MFSKRYTIMVKEIKKKLDTCIENFCKKETDKSKGIYKQGNNSAPI
jgi:hypothetical protein